MISVFGTVCIDRVRGIESLPPLGGYVPITYEKLMLGGEAVNTALQLRRWGADFELIGNPPGWDDEGRTLKDLLDREGLQVPCEGFEPAPTPVCDIYVTPDGERTMFGRGFDVMVAPPVSRFTASPGGWFSSDANLRPQADAYASAAKDSEMHLYLMDFRDAELLLGPGDFWQGSTDWVGEHGDQTANIAQLEKLVERCGCFGILTDGPNGFVAGSPVTGIRHYPAIPATNSIDSTGAGDAFRAGMLFGLDQAWPVERCLRFASAAAALSTAYQGGSNGPTRDEIEGLC